MPYCPRCGSEVDENKNFCPKCGKQLNSEAVRNTPINNFKKWYSKRHNNLEFVLALIALILAVMSISQFFTLVPLTSNIITFILIVIIVALIATVFTRYHARTGSLMLLISLLVLFALGFGNLSGAILFAVIAVVVSFVLNRFKN